MPLRADMQWEREKNGFELGSANSRARATHLMLLILLLPGFLLLLFF